MFIVMGMSMLKMENLRKMLNPADLVKEGFE